MCFLCHTDIETERQLWLEGSLDHSVYKDSVLKHFKINSIYGILKAVCHKFCSISV